MKVIELMSRCLRLSKEVKPKKAANGFVTKCGGEDRVGDSHVAKDRARGEGK